MIITPYTFNLPMSLQIADHGKSLDTAAIAFPLDLTAVPAPAAATDAPMFTFGVMAPTTATLGGTRAETRKQAETRREQLRRWQEEKRQRALQDKQHKRKPFLVGPAPAHLPGMATHKKAGIQGSALRVPSTAQRIAPDSPLLPAANLPAPSIAAALQAAVESTAPAAAPPSPSQSFVPKDSRKNLSSVFRSSAVGMASISDVFSFKLNFGALVCVCMCVCVCV
jgi:hypothetical protein